MNGFRGDPKLIIRILDLSNLAREGGRYLMSCAVCKTLERDITDRAVVTLKLKCFLKDCGQVVLTLCRSSQRPGVFLISCIWIAIIDTGIFCTSSSLFFPGVLFCSTAFQRGTLYFFYS